jgi:molybdenum cofactor cytidylyltransferase
LEVIVVVGASAEAVARALEGQPVKIVNNSDWQTGLGSSIAAGVGAVSDAAEACVLMLCDQPAITSEHLRALVKKYETEKESCVVTAFADTFGPPAVFARSMFPDLLSIPGDQGARAILREMADLPSIRFDAAAIDIDDPEDLQALTSGSANGNSDDD